MKVKTIWFDGEGKEFERMITIQKPIAVIEVFPFYKDGKIDLDGFFSFSCPTFPHLSEFHSIDSIVREIRKELKERNKKDEN